MDIVRTIVCKLNPTPEQRTEINATLKASASACNRIVEVARQIHSSNKVKLQHACYREIRKEFGLSANLTIRAIARVCAALKVPTKAHSAFSPASIDYDARIFSFREWDWTFSLTLLDSRQRIEGVLGARQKNALHGQRPTSATLVKRKDGLFFLHIQLISEAPPIEKVNGFLGVDMGIENIATTSDGEIFSGKNVDAVRERAARLKAALQRRGSKSAKRHLKKFSGREARFKRHINHVISKRIVSVAKDTERGVGIEDLNGFRKTVRKAQRERFGKWAFLQLRSFIEYKAKIAGIPVVAVNPRHTSQGCNRCGHVSRSNRKSQAIFLCAQCGFSLNADLNAALNIASRADVNRPIAVHPEPENLNLLELQSSRL